MSGVEETPGERRNARRGVIPPEIIDLVVPPLKVGGMCGVAGTMTGVGGAIIGDASPVFSGIMTGTQWAVLGTTYWFTRRVVIRSWGGEKHLTPTRKVAASTIASLPAGALMGLAAKGGRSMPSSMAFCAIVAGGGQVIANSIASRRKTDDEETGSWLESKWSPLKKLSDSEYIDMMGEKMLRVEADIALIDERIDNLREQERSELKEGLRPSGPK